MEGVLIDLQYKMSWIWRWLSHVSKTILCSFEFYVLKVGTTPESRWTGVCSMLKNKSSCARNHRIVFIPLNFLAFLCTCVLALRKSDTWFELPNISVHSFSSDLPLQKNCFSIKSKWYNPFCHKPLMTSSMNIWNFKSLFLWIT